MKTCFDFQVPLIHSRPHPIADSTKPYRPSHDWGTQRKAPSRETPSAALTCRGATAHRECIHGKRQRLRFARPNTAAMEVGYSCKGPFFRGSALGARQSCLLSGVPRQQIRSWTRAYVSDNRMDQTVAVVVKSRSALVPYDFLRTTVSCVSLA